jgi:hypothetical protein
MDEFPVVDNKPKNQTGSISANDLATPVDVPKLTQPKVGSLPNDNVINNVAKETGNIIAAQTDEAKDLKKQRQSFAALNNPGQLTDVFNTELDRRGVTDSSFAELKDINLQLADRGTASDLTKTRIAGAAGQTLGQAGREITQEDRESAVRDAGLAARAAVLQGSIETAQAAATQAVNIAFQDRQLTNDNVSKQISDLNGVVGEQTQQLLDNKQREIDADNLAIKELKDNIAIAMVSNATQAEMAQLNDSTIDDTTRLALAQSITARGATEERNLDLEGKRASNAASWALANERMEGGETITTPTGENLQVPTFEEYALEEGGKAYAMDSLSKEQLAELRQNYTDEVSVMEQATRVASLSSLARVIVQDPKQFSEVTATVRGEILKELGDAGIDTSQIALGKKKTLPATQVSSISQANGVKSDVVKLKTMLSELSGTGPIAGRLQKLDPYHPQRVAIEAQITRIVPGLARGIFGEVGVLTDTDVERYKNTLANPNMTDVQIEQMHNDTMAKIDQSINETISAFDGAGYHMDSFIDANEATTPDDGLSDEEAYQLYQESQQ